METGGGGGLSRASASNNLLWFRLCPGGEHFSKAASGIQAASGIPLLASRTKAGGVLGISPPPRIDQIFPTLLSFLPRSFSSTF